MNTPNDPQEVAHLIARWKRGEDVQDALAHKLRHLAAGCATLLTKNAALRAALEEIRLTANTAYKYSNDTRCTAYCLSIMEQAHAVLAKEGGR